MTFVVLASGGRLDAQPIDAAGLAQFEEATKTVWPRVLAATTEMDVTVSSREVVYTRGANGELVTEESTAPAQVARSKVPGQNLLRLEQRGASGQRSDSLSRPVARARP